MGCLPLAAGRDVLGFGFGNGTVKLDTAGISQSPNKMLQNNVEVRVGISKLRIVAARIGPSRAMKPVQTSAAASCHSNQQLCLTEATRTHSERNTPFCSYFDKGLIAFIGDFLENEHHILEVFGQSLKLVSCLDQKLARNNILGSPHTS
jgi:hypothetical protein